MSALKWNIAANYGGRIYTGAISIICVPLYVKFMGIESYGLIGFLVTLQNVCAVLAEGVFTTTNRELARLSQMKGGEEQIRHFLRTLGGIYWGLSVIAGATVCIFAPVLATHWLKAEQLPVSVLERAIVTMGILIVLEAPFSLYFGGLMGLEKQVLANYICMVFDTLRCFGSVAVLWLVSPTIEAYLLWQIPLAASKTLVAAFCLYSAVPKTDRRSRFEMAHLFTTGRFSLGVIGFEAISLLLTQGDKIILSKLLTLEMLGYYNLAWVLGFSLVGVLVDPIRNAAFPRFSKLVQLRDSSGIVGLYHFMCQACSVALLPVVAVTALFAHEILTIWTGDTAAAQNTEEILRLLVIGMASWGLMHTPATLQLAYGWTRLIVSMNGAALLFFIPLIYTLTAWNGPAGGGLTWILVFAPYTICGIALMHRRILKGEQWRWYAIDTGGPLLAAFGVGWIFRLMAPPEMATIDVCWYLALALASSVAASTVASPLIRAQLLPYFSSMRI